MTRSESPDLSVRQRLHPSSPFFNAARHLKKLILPAIVVFLVAQAASWERWLFLFVVPSILYEIYRFFTVRFHFATGEMVVRDGWLFNNERHIPFERIQNIDFTQTLLQRWCGVAEVRLQTASGQEPEAVLRVLAVPVVEEMRRRVFEFGEQAGAEVPPDLTTGWESREREFEVEDDGSPSPAPVSDRLLLHLPPAALMKLGLIKNRGLGLVLAGMGLAWEFDLWERFDFVEKVRPWFSDATWQRIVLLVAGTVLAGFACLLLFSLVWTFFRLYDFRLTRHGDDFRLQCGMTTRLSATVPLHRIQFVSVQETVLHRAMGAVSLQVETAGGKSEGEENASMSRRWFAPLVTPGQLTDLVAEIRPGLSLEGLDWQGLDAVGRRRLRRRALFLALLLSAGLALLFRPWGGLAIAILVPYALLHSAREGMFLAFSHFAGGIAYRSGAFTRRTSVTFHDKSQVISLHESPFDRRYAMASLHVDTAGAGTAGHRIQIPYLSRGVAKSLGEELATQAEQAAFRWS